MKEIVKGSLIGIALGLGVAFTVYFLKFLGLAAAMIALTIACITAGIAITYVLLYSLEPLYKLLRKSGLNFIPEVNWIEVGLLLIVAILFFQITGLYLFLASYSMWFVGANCKFCLKISAVALIGLFFWWI